MIQDFCPCSSILLQIGQTGPSMPLKLPLGCLLKSSAKVDAQTQRQSTILSARRPDPSILWDVALAGVGRRVQTHLCSDFPLQWNAKRTDLRKAKVTSHSYQKAPCQGESKPPLQLDLIRGEQELVRFFRWSAPCSGTLRLCIQASMQLFISSLSSEGLKLDIGKGLCQFDCESRPLHTLDLMKHKEIRGECFQIKCSVFYNILKGNFIVF